MVQLFILLPHRFSRTLQASPLQLQKGALPVKRGVQQQREGAHRPERVRRLQVEGRLLFQCLGQVLWRLLLEEPRTQSLQTAYLLIRQVKEVYLLLELQRVLTRHVQALEDRAAKKLLQSE